MNPDHRDRERYASFLCSVLLVAISILTPGRSFAACTAAEPQDVLTCYARAFSSRDMGLLEELLAADFVGANRSQPKMAPWGRQEELDSARSILGSKDVESVQLAVEEPAEVVSGADCGTWELRSVSVELRIKAKQGGAASKDYRVTSTVHFHVRLVPQPEPHYQIFGLDVIE